MLRVKRLGPFMHAPAWPMEGKVCGCLQIFCQHATPSVFFWMLSVQSTLVSEKIAYAARRVPCRDLAGPRICGVVRTMLLKSALSTSSPGFLHSARRQCRMGIASIRENSSNN